MFVGGGIRRSLLCRILLFQNIVEDGGRHGRRRAGSRVISCIMIILCVQLVVVAGTPLFIMIIGEQKAFFLLLFLLL